MVDFLGKQDHGVPAETVTPETFVSCAPNHGMSPDTPVPCIHNNGDLTPMHAAAKMYYQPVCNPQLATMVKGGCPHRKECLDLHMKQVHGGEGDHPAGMGEDLGTTPVKILDIDAAFSGLTPRANHQRRADDAEEKTQ